MARNLRYRPGCPLAAALVMLATAACGGPPVPFQLVFPSEETFLISATASVDVYEPSEDNPPDVICRNLSAGLPANQETATTTGSRDVCELDGVPLSNVPTGRVVFFAEVFGGVDRTTKLMSGCKVADVYADTTDPVQIQLSTLPDYPADPQIQCADRTAKCDNNEPCL